MAGFNIGVDYSSANGTKIILKNNSGLTILLERIRGVQGIFEGQLPGINNEYCLFYGWIEVNPAHDINRKQLEDSPLKLLIRLRDGTILKYIGQFADYPPHPEATTNDRYGFHGYSILNMSDYDDFKAHE
jgi:hypothetical protein